MAVYSVTNEELTSIADIIRSKGGITSSLAFPTDFIDAINMFALTSTYQSKTITPIETAQIITPDNGYDGISQLTVRSISSTYVGTAIERLSVYTYTPTTYNQIIPSAVYLSQAVTIQGDTNLKSDYIASGITIFNVTGNVPIPSIVYDSPVFVEYIPNNIDFIDQIFPESLPSYFAMSASNISSVSINCSYIGLSAFQDCPNLKTVRLTGCTSLADYYNYFMNTPLESLECTVLSSTNATFNGLSQLTTINFPMLESVNYYMFKSDSALKNINMPRCTTIGTQAFQWCSALSSIGFPLCTSISSQAFAYCGSLATISFPECITIGSDAFEGQNLLSNVSMPKCTTINEGAFFNCAKLTSIDFPECITIGSRAFYGDPVTTINFPKCTTIGSSAFYMCRSLRTASFPKCTTIYSGAFAQCERFRSLYLLNSSVTTLQNSSAFYYTPSLSIYVPSSLIDAYRSADNWSLISSKLVAI